MKKVIPSLLLLIPSLCRADGTLDRELAFDALMAIDYGQTRVIFRGKEGYYEYNSLISRRHIGQYFFAATLVHAMVTYGLPREYRPMWQWSTIVVEGAVVGHNAYIGIGVRW